MFKEVNNKIKFPEMEKEVLKFWEEGDIFKKSMEQRESNKEYVFYDGPPFATGLPHYGHLVGGTLKDVIPRFWTMKGRYVSRRFGWDCHGLPVEYEVEKELEFKSKKDIETFGIDKFNETCRSIVLKYVNEWETIIKRTGRWVDFENDYKTMEPEYMESVWNVFKTIWDKDLIKKGYRVNPFCPRCSTPLSKHEANLNYKDTQDPAITIVLKVIGEENLYFTAWTTTPWTLPSNAALAVKNSIEYQYIKPQNDDRVLIMAKSRVPAYFKEGTFEVVKEVTGEALVGMRYEPLFDYYKDCDPNVHQVIEAAYVTTEDGTGIVHQAPAFGQEDFEVSRPYGVPVLNPINEMGQFNDPVTDYKGMYIKDADKMIIRRLKDENKLLLQSTIQHSYPFCYRCDTPLLQKATDSWVMEIEPIKNHMIKNNREINWVPGSIKYGRFGKLLENSPEWHISRNRYWGAPLPIWECEDCGKRECFGSIEELKNRSGNNEITDIHKHFVDPITFNCSCGSKMKRVPEVLDCWFESGSMPYAQNHYPFKNKERFEKNFPCDFIAEGIDQTRGWFNKLLVLSTALFDKPAFKNVIVNGTVLAEDGTKMSKSKRNFPPVTDILDKFGADAMRMYLINSPAVRAENLRFSEEGVKDVIKKVMLPLWNSYSFFVTYANIDNWQPSGEKLDINKLNNRLDKWILSSLQSLIKNVDREMSSYKVYNVLPEMVNFIDDMTNWYIRRSRRRFWKSENDGDKSQGYEVLYYTLKEFVHILAPVMPFISDKIYRNLELSVNKNSKESVHLNDFPTVQEQFINTVLEEEMAFVQTVVKLGRVLRNEKNIKIRQPLSAITVVANREVTKKAIRDMKDLIMEELNVKDVLITEKEEDLVSIIAKPNFRVIGKKYGKDVKVVSKVISNLSVADIKKIEAGEEVEFELGKLIAEDMSIEHNQKEGIFAASEGDITVSLDINISEDLLIECHARELVNKIQNLRKESGYEISDRIIVEYNGDEDISGAISKMSEYIMSETLAKDIVKKETIENSQQIEINKLNVEIGIKKANL
ncbi:MAG: isoleucine--tRNA ligase [Candidatus Cloacimonadota bacterium]|nr:MAG: isoleucine--tRNA ligase [Candidatus Cloacimonadota bacterium]PIE78046.1 MAG: isoleucine--tRNA ligase [Candidatus Delongbacteria bacterium]